jgi:thiol-disulfide isomerase/thioredoxin
MKRKSNIVLGFVCATILSSVLAGCSSSTKVAVKPNEHMEVGWTPRTVFQSPSYAAWFDTGYSKYQPQKECVDRLLRMQDSVAIQIVYGTWCSDSKREIPRFMKIVDQIAFPQDRISLIAVDRTMQVPAGISKEYGITNVPTFMVKYRGIEIGRIVESPRKTLEEDLVGLLSPFFP